MNRYAITVQEIGIRSDDKPFKPFVLYIEARNENMAKIQTVEIIEENSTFAMESYSIKECVFLGPVFP